MTELEAQRILNEIRTDNPIFVRGRYRFDIRRDGKINVWIAVGMSGQRWKSDRTAAGDEAWIPADVRERAAEERRHFAGRAGRQA